MARTRSALAAALALGVAAALSAAPPARAQVTSGSGNQCLVSGQPVMPFDLDVYDQPSGGSAIARFTGGQTALAASDFPRSGGRARVRTGTGTGSFRIAGYVDASRIPVFTAQDVAVVPSHLWIAEQRRVRVTGASPGKLQVELRVSAPIQQTFTTRASCGELTLTQQTAPGWTVPGHARGYVVKQDEARMYATPGGDLVTVLRRAPASAGILLWSRERQGAWVHVEYHGDIRLDAWARAGELEALPPGETMDQLRRPVLQRGSPRLRLAEKPRVVRTTKQVPLRTTTSESSPIIGFIEADTDTYVLEVVAGWASVMPEAMNIAPVAGGEFWVKAADLGLPD
jgi:hypothetical protein